MPSVTPIRAMVNAARNALHEAHPHARNPRSLKAHDVYVPFYLQRLGRTASWYFTVGPLILGWPIIAAEIFKRTGI